MSTDDVKLDPDSKLARRPGFSAVLKKLSKTNTGTHPAILVMMHPTTNTVVKNGAVQIACRPISDDVLQLVWHEMSDRPVTELLPKLKAENADGFAEPKNAHHFMAQSRSILGAGFSEVDSAFGTMRADEVGELHVNLISPERIPKDTRDWAVMSCGHDNGSTFFIIPLYETNQPELESGLEVT